MFDWWNALEPAQKAVVGVSAVLTGITVGTAIYEARERRKDINTLQKIHDEDMALAGFRAGLLMKK